MTISREYFVEKLCAMSLEYCTWGLPSVKRCIHVQYPTHLRGGIFLAHTLRTHNYITLDFKPFDGIVCNYKFLELLYPQLYIYPKKLKTLKVGLEVIEAFFKIPIHKHIAMKVAFGIRFLISLEQNFVSSLRVLSTCVAYNFVLKRYTY